MGLDRSFRLVLEKTTRNTVVYSDLDGDFKQIYIPRDLFPTNKYPKRIVMHLEGIDE